MHKRKLISLAKLKQQQQKAFGIASQITPFLTLATFQTNKETHLVRCWVHVYLCLNRQVVVDKVNNGRNHERCSERKWRHRETFLSHFWHEHYDREHQLKEKCTVFMASFWNRDLFKRDCRCRSHEERPSNVMYLGQFYDKYQRHRTEWKLAVFFS